MALVGVRLTSQLGLWAVAHSQLVLDSAMLLLFTAPPLCECECLMANGLGIVLICRGSLKGANEFLVERYALLNPR